MVAPTRPVSCRPAEESLQPRAAGFSLRSNPGLHTPPRPALHFHFLGGSIVSLETEIRALTNEVKALAAIARAIVAGRSLNADTAAPADAAAPEAPATVTPSPAAPAPAPAEAVTPAAPEPVEKPAEAPKAELAPEAAAPAAEVENVPKDPSGFMAALHALVVGRSDAKDVMRAALEAIGASSFRTLDSARYAEALAAVKAELAKAEA